MDGTRLPGDRDRPLGSFFFFACLAPINSCMDYLVRKNIENRYQGRVWAFIGLISQMGFILAYGLAGPLADNLFTPALMEDGALASSIGKWFGVGPGRGIGLEIILAGILLSLAALVVLNDSKIRQLEITDSNVEEENENNIEQEELKTQEASQI